MKAEISIDKAREYLSQLDFTYLIETVCSSHYPLPRWTEDEARIGCELYKNFLLLIKMHPDLYLVPTRDIDEWWHAHILYTQRYTNDCMKIYGHYLHHEPASPTEDTGKLIEGFAKTKELYLALFNQPLVTLSPRYNDDSNGVVTP